MLSTTHRYEASSAVLFPRTLCYWLLVTSLFRAIAHCEYDFDIYTAKLQRAVCLASTGPQDTISSQIFDSFPHFLSLASKPDKS